MKICKVETKREVIDTNYQVCDKFCCKTLEKWLSINDSNYRYNLLWNKTTARFEIKVRKSSEYSYGERDYSSVTIDFNFCPFCGEKLQEPMIKEANKPKKKKLFRK